MKILHTADLHLCREHAEEGLKSLNAIKGRVAAGDIDAVIVAGDTWDSAIINSETSCFNSFLDVFSEIAKHSPIVTVYGTPTHDVTGSLEILKRFGVTVAQGFCEIPTRSGLLGIVGIPEPRRSAIVSMFGDEAGKDKIDDLIRKGLDQYAMKMALEVKKEKEFGEYEHYVCVYHGDVAGCKYRPNSAETIERGTGIAMTTDQLMSIGCDYYALGHIHDPQQIGTLPMYYAGSAYPKNFGETHDAGFNVVDLECMEVERDSYGHPQNVKITSADWEKNDVYGKRVWLCLKSGDEKELLEKLMENGAVAGSRVSINPDADETVRASEITEVKTTAEKVDVYAKASGTEKQFTDGVHDKIRELDNVMSEKTGNGSGSWRLIRVKLRGAIGIWKGLHKDEITVDFTKYANGLIAVCGKNGNGKTTLIENCHAYPQLLTRNGTLKDNFRLRDSCREVVYQNATTGQYRKFLIQIDGETKSGLTKYYAFTSNNDADYEPVPEVDGTLAPYNALVNSLFGDINLFMRTSFITQKSPKNLPDLASATKGEKKQLFAELAGISYLQGYADKAKDNGDAIARENEKTEAQLEILRPMIEAKKSIEEEIARNESIAAEAEAALPDLEKRVNVLKEKVAGFETVSRHNADVIEKINELNRQIADIKSKNEAVSAKMIRLRDSISKEAEAENTLKTYQEYEAEHKAENDKMVSSLSGNAALMSEYEKANSEFNDSCKDAESKIRDLTSKISENDFSYKTVLRDIKDLEEKVAKPFDDTCPYCGQKLPEDQIEPKRKLFEQNKKSLEGKNTDKAKFENVLSGLKKDLEEVQEERDAMDFNAPIKPKLATYNRAHLDDLESKMRNIDKSGAEKIIQEAATAKAVIEELKNQFTGNAEQNEKLNKDLESVKAELEPYDSLEHSQAMTAQTEAETALSEKEKEKQFAEYGITTGKEKLADIEAKSKEIRKLQKECDKNEQNIDEWKYLEKAFGKDGIQALELDALSPNIASIANRILKKAGYDKFSIDFATTRIGGTGSKTKQIEDFIIYAIDNSDGSRTTIDNLSGGESIWIRKAIYEAFTAMRRQNTNFSFLTSFNDEADGALDEQSKEDYTRILEAAREESKIEQIVVITQSEEVKAMIDQKIEMAKL